MLKLQVQSSVQHILVQCVFVEESMSCLCFSMIPPNSNPYRLVLYFLLLCFCFEITNIVAGNCWFYIIFGSGPSHSIYTQFIAQATAHNNFLRLGCLDVLELDLPHGILCYSQAFAPKSCAEGNNSQPNFFCSSQRMIELLQLSMILWMRSSWKQFISFWGLFSQLWRLCSIATQTFLQWTNSTTLWNVQMRHYWIHRSISMMRICVV